MRKPKFNFFAAIGMVVALGTVAFTAPVSFSETNWYSVTPHSSNPDLDVIGSISPDPFENGDCISTTPTQRCAIQLTLDSPGDKPSTVGEAEQNGQAGASTYRNP